MMNIISTIGEPSLNILLYGDENLDKHAIEVIFLTVLKQSSLALSRRSLSLSLCYIHYLIKQ